MKVINECLRGLIKECPFLSRIIVGFIKLYLLSGKVFISLREKGLSRYDY